MNILTVAIAVGVWIIAFSKLQERSVISKVFTEHSELIKALREQLAEIRRELETLNNSVQSQTRNSSAGKDYWDSVVGDVD